MRYWNTINNIDTAIKNNKFTISAYSNQFSRKIHQKSAVHVFELVRCNFTHQETRNTVKCLQEMKILSARRTFFSASVNRRICPAAFTSVAFNSASVVFLTAWTIRDVWNDRHRWFTPMVLYKIRALKGAVGFDVTAGEAPRDAKRRHDCRSKRDVCIVKSYPMTRNILIFSNDAV